MEEFDIRMAMLEKMRQAGLQPFAYTYKKTADAKDIPAKFSGLEPGQEKPEKFSVAGRVLSTRGHGKIMFIDLEDQTGKLQVVVNAAVLGEKAFASILEFIGPGDIIGVKGHPMKTKRGELSLSAEELSLLTKSLRGLPSKWYGLKDVEKRYRQRYLDLLMNPEVKQVFVKRSQIIDSIRQYMKSKGYLEVETPIMQPLYGGAMARPFITHHNTLKKDMYLRISNEMYLKRLIAGGFEKVFEFSVDFRNEGIDTTHNPEFLMMEAMTAYSDYKDGMGLVEGIVSHAAKAALGTTKVKFRGHDIDLAPPWERLTVFQAVKKHAGLDVEKSSLQEVVAFVKKHNLRIISKQPTKGELAAALFEELVEPKLIQPTIVYDYPLEISPLAKKSRDNPGVTERFEVFIAGSEYSNNYTEITDPLELRHNFKYQLKRGQEGDEESHPMDEDFLTAMEHGMPPTCGIGIGIDRLVMLLTGSESIRDVVFFPQLRDREPGQEVFGDEVKDTVLEKRGQKK